VGRKLVEREALEIEEETLHVGQAALQFDEVGGYGESVVDAWQHEDA
jgi:hypothetical protein